MSLTVGSRSSAPHNNVEDVTIGVQLESDQDGLMSDQNKGELGLPIIDVAEKIARVESCIAQMDESTDSTYQHIWDLYAEHRVSLQRIHELAEVLFPELRRPTR